jgi:hypothetical protein
MTKKERKSFNITQHDIFGIFCLCWSMCFNSNVFFCFLFQIANLKVEIAYGNTPSGLKYKQRLLFQVD